MPEQVLLRETYIVVRIRIRRMPVQVVSGPRHGSALFCLNERGRREDCRLRRNNHAMTEHTIHHHRQTDRSALDELLYARRQRVYVALDEEICLGLGSILGHILPSRVHAQLRIKGQYIHSRWGEHRERQVVWHDPLIILLTSPSQRYSLRVLVVLMIVFMELSC